MKTSFRCRASILSPCFESTLARATTTYLEPSAVDALCHSAWTVTSRSDRVGVRLEGPPLRRKGEQPEPRSEGMVTAAVQVPAGGQLIVFLANHPTTGGYPAIAVVAADDLALAAQTRPGTARCASG